MLLTRKLAIFRKIIAQQYGKTCTIKVLPATGYSATGFSFVK